ncbi:MAG TPA: DUF2891 domain-containing protein [Steroidobacteraceae bacterium]|nr:DUF2891 domain-containing protein [Steroidobacteraceae bacterium]
MTNWGRSAGCAIVAIGVLGSMGAGADADSPARPAPIDPQTAGRFAGFALKCLHEEYPNHISHTLSGDADVKPPRELTPAFYGCYDWHSAVHAHWLLARLLHLFPDADFATAARAAIAESLTAAHVEGEVRYLEHEDRASFERPYGLAWLLALCAELRAWQDPQAQQWAAILQPLESEAAMRLENWAGKLRYPIRVGEHDQTAFSFGLVWDWAGVAQNPQMRSVLAYAARRFYEQDRDCPLSYEPSGEDFLSPCLGEADFMRRVLAPEAFAHWLSGFLPKIPKNARQAWLDPAVVVDRADPKLAHTDGLNLSRAWMLEGIASGLPPSDRRIAALRAAALMHSEAALPNITGEHYVGAHWLGTFAVYLTSEAGLQ